MAITQKRIYELEDYTQLLPDDVGYVDPTNIYIPVDCLTESWNEPKKLPLNSVFLSASHIEASQLNSLASRTVSILFETPFVFPVIPFVNVYRDIAQDGVVIRQNVLINSMIISTTGIDFEIDADESLTDVVVNYIVIQG